MRYHVSLSRRYAIGAIALAVGLVVSACSSSGSAGGGESATQGTGDSSSNSSAGEGASSGTADQSINVIMVNNPAQEDLVKLTPDNFTKQTGIKVNFTLLPENDVRAKISQEFSSQAGQYDVATLSNYEIPFYANNGWLAPLDKYIAADTAFDQADILPAMAESMKGKDGKIYGEPFEGQSSFLMYRKDVFEAKGLTVPSNPTWDQVAELAAKIDHAEPGMRGICLRGQPGWGEMFAPLTTVINTFGGTWFDKDWNAQVDSPAFQQAVEFYVKLIQEHGEDGAAQSGYTECLNDFIQGKVAMWVDATNSGGSIEASNSPIHGKIGYAQSPVKLTKSSGWLWTWAWGIQAASKHQDAAWKFVSWASSKDYELLVAKKLGWAKVPYGKRESTFKNPDFQAGAPFYKAALEAIESVSPENSFTQPRPAAGVQFVGIPEFAALATDLSRDISAVIAGQGTVAAALAKGQKAAEAVGAKYKNK
ncbi:MAG: sugar ABC transporter substrate-binding protein [Actinobacteria bacterium 69-20]|jgi:sorbitol/mannitol transport system substrate-binding protein|nr:sugar ABC transporter substrate-binding protein [Actinomycetota bacterium]OJV23622.1 MAG: sugar ABC transporter substrate-binding protein [Actinobacteria bacterium 69-20]